MKIHFLWGVSDNDSYSIIIIFPDGITALTLIFTANAVSLTTSIERCRQTCEVGGSPNLRSSYWGFFQGMRSSASTRQICSSTTESHIILGRSAVRSVRLLVKNATGNVTKWTINGHFCDVPVMFSTRTRTDHARRMQHIITYPTTRLLHYQPCKWAVPLYPVTSCALPRFLQPRCRLISVDSYCVYPYHPPLLPSLV